MAVRPMKVWNAATSTWDDVAVSQRGDVVNATDYAAKGDIIAGTGAGTYDNIAAGSNGQMLMADSSATAGLRYVDPPTNRNLVINGAMNVAQRGTSSTGITTNGYYTADRWRHDLTSLGTWTQSVETDAPTGSGLAKSLKVLCTTADAAPAAGDRMAIQQRIEGQNVQRMAKGTSSAQQVSLSFWAKANVTGTYVAMIEDSNARYASVSYSISAADTWEKKNITFAADTTGTITNDNLARFVLWFWLGAGTTYTSGTLQSGWQTTVANVAAGQTNLAAAQDNYWQITGVQLEVGPVATPFEFEPYEATLRKCYRYYYKITGDDAFSGVAYGHARTTTDVVLPVHLPVTMRTKPSSVDYSTLRLSDYQNAGIAISALVLKGTRVNRNVATIEADCTGATQYRNYALELDNDLAGYLAFSAEL